MKNCQTEELPPVLELIPEEWMPQPGPWVGTELDLERCTPKVKKAFPDLQIGLYPHKHAWHELEIICRGNGIHHIGGQDFQVSAGDVYAVPPDTVHNFTKLSDDFYYVDVFIMMERLELPMKQLRQLPGFNMLLYVEPTRRYPDGFKSRLRLQRPEFNRLIDMRTALTNELLTRPLGYEAQAVALTTQMLVFLGRNYGQNGMEDSGGALSGISDALALIERSYARPLTLPELADAAHMSLRSFQRNFMSVMETRVTEYIRKVRLEHAAAMLRHTSQDILGIALSCGFQDGIYFSQCFRRHFGCSPSQYRQK